MKSIDIFDQKGKKTSYFNPVNPVERKVSPFNEIINHGDYSQYSVSFGNEEKNSLSNAFQLQVNVTDIGIFHFLFNNQYFSKEDVTPAISELKNITVDSLKTAVDKLTVLINIIRPYNPLLIIYDPIGPYALNELYVATIGKNEIIFILPEGEGVFPTPKTEDNSKELKVDESKPKPVKPAKEPKEKKAKEKIPSDKGDNKFKYVLGVIWNGIKAFFAPIKEDKFYFVFALLASFIIGFTTGTGVYNAYEGKGIAVFFFICCTAGAILNGFVYSDLSKVTPIKSMKFVTSASTSLVGFLLSVGGAAIFFSFQTIPEDFPSMGTIYGTFIPIALAIIVLSMFSSYLIKLIFKKKVKE